MVVSRTFIAGIHGMFLELLLVKYAHIGSYENTIVLNYRNSDCSYLKAWSGQSPRILRCRRCRCMTRIQINLEELSRHFR